MTILPQMNTVSLGILDPAPGCAATPIGIRPDTRLRLASIDGVRIAPKSWSLRPQPDTAPGRCHRQWTAPNHGYPGSNRFTFGELAQEALSLDSTKNTQPFAANQAQSVAHNGVNAIRQSP
ncbi:hypothetical protein B0H14DRAFT_2622734 [Mycena olivaceomarginata]|nr:hypothetical protein B0H14DRAFT_2622734 [Mycena olivaceomarginata]